MAIADIAAYAHLSEADIEALGYELDAIRCEIEESLGENDAAYIRRTIRFQRTLDVVARLLIGCQPVTGRLGVGDRVAGIREKCREHGNWPQREPWSMGLDERPGDSLEHVGVGHGRGLVAVEVFAQLPPPRVQQRLGVDDDLGFGVMRVTRDQPWKPQYLLQPLQNLLLAATFEWGIAVHDVDLERIRAASAAEKAAQARALIGKVARQAVKDYVLFPALSGSRWRRTLAANASANLVRNLWAYMVIFCGHFPDGAEKFTADVLDNETRPEWYLRQMLGAANFKAGPLLAFSSGNLCYQIEHHLFPDLPSNRYAQIAVRVRALCDKYDLPYTSGSLVHQYLLTLRTIHKLALPDGFLVATCDDAPETASERKFGTGAATGRPIRCRDNGAAKRVANRVAGQCPPTPTTTKASSQTTPVGPSTRRAPVAIFPAPDNRSGAPTVCR